MIAISKINDDQEKQETKPDKIRAIIDGIGDILFVMDKNRIITEVNKTTCEVFNKKPEEMLGKHCYEIVHGKDCPWPSCPATKTFETKQSVTKEINDPNLGIPLLVTTSPILDEQGEVAQIIHIAKDITKFKQAEMELHLAANLFETASDSIFVHDVSGRMVYFNGAAFKTRGYTRDEFEALSIQQLEAQGNPEFFESQIKNLLNAGELTFETINFRKDKTVMPVEIHAQVIEFDNQKLILTIARDISLRKAEEAKLKENGERISLMVEKLRVVGSLTRHDVRNKLSTVTGYAYLLKKKHSGEADVVEGLGKMEQAVKETIRIFDFAKMYEQLGVEDLTYIDVESKLKEACALFSGSLPNIINECQGLTVLADSFLRQLFYNFIDNTRKYGKKTTAIRMHYEKTNPENLKLVYEDDGVGISLENKVQLFKEGFSTGGSTGFGLFLTKKMIDVYGWQIQESGLPGEGVKFVISIPKLNKNGRENFQIT